ncbi:uncharacterized protein LOC132630651 [Lycium barbarum]|uniref:uncharacterized protein LOC132630651 n=1 Tax=Lycium barbarum TaxID=112863 RepID=UPI00293E29DC|nr:uncharacterized protein LOC132630651 [Lycium barbarum]
MVLDMDIDELLVIRDSDLLIHQVQGEWATKIEKILPYVNLAQKLCKKFKKIEFPYTPRAHNEFADALDTIASMIQHPKSSHIDPLRISLKEEHVRCCQIVLQRYLSDWAPATDEATEFTAGLAQPDIIPPPVLSDVMVRVLNMLNGFKESGVLPAVPGAPGARVDDLASGEVHALELQHAVALAPRLDEALGLGVFPRPVGEFFGTEVKDSYEFIMDYHERLHKMGAMEKYDVEFVAFQLLGDAKLWWRDFVECKPVGSSPLTLTQFYQEFLDKYVSRILRDWRHDEFNNIEQGNLSVAAYEAWFHSLSRYALQLMPIEEERVRRFVKRVEHCSSVVSSSACSIRCFLSKSGGSC